MYLSRNGTRGAIPVLGLAALGLACASSPAQAQGGATFTLDQTDVTLVQG